MAPTLLRTKLYIPRLPRSLVQRQVLVERLEAELDRDLTLVVAPVGYGKTTTVAAWAAQTALPVAWLTLNENDNDLVGFISYLIAAIETLFPDACPQVRSVLENQRLPEVDLLATFLVNEIDDLPQRFALVLDDYHLVHAPAVHALLDHVLRHAPVQMHLLIVSRADPPLTLSRLRAAQRMHELRIKDLRFSLAEAEVFLDHKAVLADRARALQVLTVRTEGWIAGLQLAALSMQAAADQAIVLRHLERGADRYIMDYLFEQVLQQQSPAIQAFLLKTSILERISPALAFTIVDDEDSRPEAQVSLLALERTGIFVTALDNSGEWYCYHALFRELLRHQFETRSTKEQIAGLQRRASAWFQVQGLIDEALHHALAAADVDLAAQIILDHFATWLNREDWHAIEHWLNLLPATAFAAHPWLLVARANIAQTQSDYAAVLPLIEEAEARLGHDARATPSPGEAVLRGYLDQLWASHWYMANQPERAIAAAEHALLALPPAHRYVRGTAYLMLTMALTLAGRAASAEQFVKDELARLPAVASNTYLRLRLLLCLMSVQIAVGNLQEGELTARTLLQESTLGNAPISALWAHLALGTVAYERNDLPRALEHFAQGANLRHAGHTRAGHECLIWLALTYQVLGQAEAAQSTLRLLADFDRQSANPVLRNEVESLRLRLQVLNGEQPDIGDWGSRDAALPTILLGWRENPLLTRVCVLLAHSTPAALAEAHARLDELVALAAALHKPARQAELLALQARLWEQRGERNPAILSLQAAIALGEPRGLVRSLADAGAPLAPVLLAVAQDAPSPYLDRVLNALRGSSVATETSIAPVSQPQARIRLTRREREVLALLGAYKTDREIAEDLVISPLTVRTHIEHIGEKLGATGRRAIVARAIEQNLLA